MCEVRSEAGGRARLDSLSSPLLLGRCSGQGLNLASDGTVKQERERQGTLCLSEDR